MSELYTAGIDEAGRGPLAGPVVAAAVIMPQDWRIDGIRDSKKLTAKKREVLFDEIYATALAIGIGISDHIEIDKINILQATFKAMQRAAANLPIEPTKILVDGNMAPKFSCKAYAIIRGDLIEPIISAASIVAKVTRDKKMQEIDLIYPQYKFINHKGYPTKLHIEILNKIGPCAVHRKTYAPVKRSMQNIAFYE